MEGSVGRSAGKKILGQRVERESGNREKMELEKEVF